MAFENFKPTIWATGVEHNFPSVNVFAGLSNQRIQGGVSYGNRVIINSIGEVTTQAYSGTVTYETLDDYALEMLIDQKKYFALEIDDVDAIQSHADLMREAQIEIGKAVAKDPDLYIAGLYGQSGLVSGGTHSSISPVSITSSNIISTLGTVRDKLAVNDVMDDIVAVVPPWFMTKINYGQIVRDTNNSQVLTAGYKGKFMEIDFYVSNNVSHSAETWYAPMFFKRSRAIAFAMQLEKVEAGRRDASFKDYIRGLMVYGAKVYRPDAICTLYCANGIESGTL